MRNDFDSTWACVRWIVVSGTAAAHVQHELLPSTEPGGVLLHAGKMRQRGYNDTVF